MDNIGIIKSDSREYPPLLGEIETPPKQIFYMGDPSILLSTAVAIVGARRATDYGKWVAYQMGKNLAACGAVVVSGLAWGIDEYAHKGALDAGGKTIAVLGSGVDVCYPKRNEDIYNEIKNRGLILSEYPSQTTPQKYMFPQRNRIISGLSICTVVVEAGIKSGALITAELAAEQGRAVYAVPGNIDRTASFGCNKLIQDGAFPVTTIADFISDIGMVAGHHASGEEEELSKDERRVFRIVKEHGEISIDGICNKVIMDAAVVSGIVTVLEIKGWVHSAMGKIFVAK